MKQEERIEVYRRAVALFRETPPRYAKNAYDAIHRAHLKWHTSRDTLFICNTVQYELQTCVIDSVLWLAVDCYVRHRNETQNPDAVKSKFIKLYGLPKQVGCANTTEWYYSRLALWEIILIIADALIHEQTEKYYV